MRILVFGDSVTQGFWDTEGGWVERLRREYDTRALENKEDRYYATIFNLGISGDKSDSVLKRMRSEVEARKWQDEEFVLIFAVGTNNTYIKNGQPYGSVEQYASDIEKVLKTGKEYAKKLMVIGLASCDESRTKPVFWDNVIWENSRIRQFDESLQKICQQSKVKFVPIFEKFQKEQKKRNLLEDGIHPNNDGHEFLAKLIRPELAKLINS